LRATRCAAADSAETWVTVFQDLRMFLESTAVAEGAGVEEVEGLEEALRVLAACLFLACSIIT